jgi:hypothetical protein
MTHFNHAFIGMQKVAWGKDGAATRKRNATQKNTETQRHREKHRETENLNLIAFLCASALLCVYLSLSPPFSVFIFLSLSLSNSFPFRRATFIVRSCALRMIAFMEEHTNGSER